ncbi:hypothetical protein DXT87_14450 [Arthrobacter sp. AET 35A]|nr:hypothetical protein [Arthrobacter sp. AET 35A]
MRESLEVLDGLLTAQKNPTPQRDGIHFQGQPYLAPASPWQIPMVCSFLTACRPRSGLPLDSRVPRGQATVVCGHCWLADQTLAAAATTS